MSTTKTTKPTPICVVQGAQWGSEGKGMVAAAICRQRNINIAVRTGAVNAGHTVYLQGKPIPFKMQQLPTGWINRRTKLVIGPGALIHPDIFAAEIKLIKEVTGEDIRCRLYIDHRAGLHVPEHTKRAQSADRHHLIGATGKGCSEALVERIRGRGTTGRLFTDWLTNERDLYPHGAEGWELNDLTFTDTVHLLHNGYDAGESILLEGTQGSHLDLYLGPYPYTTHKPTQASTWVTEAGLAPGMEYEVLMVARAYPIRVAGNSGPMTMETCWPEVTRRMNERLRKRGLPPRVHEQSIKQFEQACAEVARSQKYSLPDWDNHEFHLFGPHEQYEYRVAMSELHKDALNMLPGPVLADLCRVFEMTTVTNKLRRVADFDASMVTEACRWNRAAGIVLTFMNHWMPELWDSTSAMQVDGDAITQVNLVEKRTGYPVVAFTTGPRTEHYHEIPR